jgi:hypothetical protein
MNHADVLGLGHAGRLACPPAIPASKQTRNSERRSPTEGRRAFCHGNEAVSVDCPVERRQRQPNGARLFPAESGAKSSGLPRHSLATQLISHSRPTPHQPQHDQSPLNLTPTPPLSAAAERSSRSYDHGHSEPQVLRPLRGGR